MGTSDRSLSLQSKLKQEASLSVGTNKKNRPQGRFFLLVSTEVERLTYLGRAGGEKLLHWSNF